MLPAVVRTALAVGVGVLLIVLGFLDAGVQVGAIVAGLFLVGVIGGDELARLIRAARGRNGGT